MYKKQFAANSCRIKPKVVVGFAVVITLITFYIHLYMPTYSPAPKITSPEWRRINPVLYNQLLPHLAGATGNDSNLDPLIVLKAQNVRRSPPDLLIIIPSIKRPNRNYLMNTLQNLVTNIRPEERRLVQFVVLLAESDLNDKISVYINETVKLIRANFSEEVADGLIEVFVPPPKWYPPDLDKITPTFNDSSQRMRWRAKQNLDYAYAMLYARHYHPRSRYYLQLEDDIITLPRYLTEMKRFAEEYPRFFMCEFSVLGFIGKMFHLDDLFAISQIILLLYRSQPVDWILPHFLSSKYCMPRDIPCYKRVGKIYESEYSANCYESEYSAILNNANEIEGKVLFRRWPSLFQHVGLHSSLVGKVQNLTEKSFKRALNESIEAETSGNPPVVSVQFLSNIPSSKYGNASWGELYENFVPVRIERPGPDHFLLINFTTEVTLTGIEILFSIRFSDSDNLNDGTENLLQQNVAPFSVYIICKTEQSDASCRRFEAVGDLFTAAIASQKIVTTVADKFAITFKNEHANETSAIQLDSIRIQFRENNFANFTFTSLRMIV